MDPKIVKFSQFISHAGRVVVLTGAGISTESGISDYRSKGGLWQRFQPVTLQEFLLEEEKRREYWKHKFELLESLQTARPNEGHRAIVDLDKSGRLKGVITQNIDGLHQMAGLADGKLLEMHGTNREIICLNCGDVSGWEIVFARLKQGDNVPLCVKCHGLLKPRTISFGQNLNPNLLDEAFRWAGESDLFLAVGSTLVVEPAASLPRIAKRNGARLVIVTLSETPLDHLADLKIEAALGTTLRQAVDAACFPDGKS